MHYTHHWGKLIARVQPESQIAPAFLRMNIHKNQGICLSLLVIPTLVGQHSQVYPKFSSELQCVPKRITITRMELQYQSSDIPVTLKARRNALLECDFLLNLTLLSLHSTFSQILLEAPSDWNTFCWWISIHLHTIQLDSLQTPPENNWMYAWSWRLSEPINALGDCDQASWKMHFKPKFE